MRIVTTENSRKLMLKIGDNACKLCKRIINNGNFIYYCDVEQTIFCERCGRELGDVRNSKVWKCLNNYDLKANAIGEYVKLNGSMHSHPLVSIHLEAKQ